MSIFTALADPTRLKIIEMLAKEGTLSVARINEPFDMSAPAVSQHLKVLRDTDMVVVSQKGQMRFYKLNMSKIEQLEGWVNRIRAGMSPLNDLSGPRKKRATSTGAKKGALNSFLLNRAQK